jgi:membrane protein CcdC involved in cytochrome C biogenesis
MSPYTPLVKYIFFFISHDLTKLDSHVSYGKGKIASVSLIKYLFQLFHDLTKTWFICWELTTYKEKLFNYKCFLINNQSLFYLQDTLIPELQIPLSIVSCVFSILLSSAISLLPFYILFYFLCFCSFIPSRPLMYATFVCAKAYYIISSLRRSTH